MYPQAALGVFVGNPATEIDSTMDYELMAAQTASGFSIGYISGQSVIGDDNIAFVDLNFTERRLVSPTLKTSITDDARIVPGERFGFGIAGRLLIVTRNKVILNVGIPSPQADRLIPFILTRMPGKFPYDFAHSRLQ
jgi:hypothetical protein